MTLVSEGRRRSSLGLTDRLLWISYGPQKLSFVVDVLSMLNASGPCDC